MTAEDQLRCKAFAENENGKDKITVNNKEYTGMWVEGYYARRCLNTPCPVTFDGETSEDKEPQYQECLVIEIPGDWGMPGKLSFMEIVPDTVCRCTGRVDKNCKFIYENDIISQEIRQEGLTTTRRGLIYYDQYQGQWQVRSLPNYEFNGSYRSLFDTLYFKEAEIVGSKFTEEIV